MNLLPTSDFATLLEARPGPCVSLYFTLPAAARTPKGATSLRHLLSQASEQLAAKGLDGTAIESLLKPLKAYDPSFGSRPEEGVALFQAPGFTRVFHLPLAFPERCMVGDCFFLKPLLPLVASEDRFYVLALSQNEVRLLEATCRTVERPAVKGLPTSLADALGGQKTAQYLQYHTASTTRGGGRPAFYHGHGVGDEDVKEELRRYLRKVETAMRKFLAGRKAPVVLAGAEPLVSLYREISGDANLAGTAISGNPEHLTDEELRDRAWRILEPAFQEQRRRAAERFGDLTGSHQVSNDVTEILPAALHGRVGTLFLACDADLWGRLDAREKVDVHPAPEAGDEELLNATAVFSLRHGGTVYGMNQNGVPGGAAVAAVFRY